MKYFKQALSGALIAVMLLAIPACGRTEQITCYPATDPKGNVVSAGRR